MIEGESSNDVPRDGNGLSQIPAYVFCSCLYGRKSESSRASNYTRRVVAERIVEERLSRKKRSGFDRVLSYFL